jgi:putative membrane protein
MVLRRFFHLLLEWACLAVGVFIAARLNFLSYNNDLGTLALVVILLGILNSVLRPFLVAVFLIVSLPILILTLGLGAYLVLFLANGAILGLTAYLVKGFSLTSWWAATLTISACSWFMASALGIDQLKPFRRAQAAKKGEPYKDDAIDV